ncbi:MAG: hypothetical protein NTV33_05785 [Coprothermobacterota bacterium]|nr:hypothetical protein [Coprothermobacterota bacterium]
MRFQAVGLTDRGLLRPLNEDAYFLSAQRGLTDGLPFFLVADGLGGLAGGAQASRLAVETVSAFLLDSKGARPSWQNSDPPLLSRRWPLP